MTDPVTQISHEELCRRMAAHIQDKLVQGHPIVYEDPEYPDETIREYPDGHRMILRAAPDGSVNEVSEIPPRQPAAGGQRRNQR